MVPRANDEEVLADVNVRVGRLPDLDVKRVRFEYFIVL